MSKPLVPSSAVFAAYRLPAVSTKLRSVVDINSAPSERAATPVSAPWPPTPTPRATSSSTPDTVTDAGASSAAQSTNGVVSRPNRTMDMDALHARVAKRRKTKDRTPEEASAMLETATGIAASLAADHIAVLYPDVDTPFTDAVDVVTRLLPYHVFHQPKEDLDAQTNSQHASSYRKGKRKATEEDLIREEIAETKFALECWHRRRALEERFRKARIRSGKRPSPDDQAYVLAQAVLDSERTETASLNAELRNARAELDRLEREKRLAAPPPPPVTPRTVPTYYPQASTPASSYVHQYRGYTYPYAQAYGTSQYTYNPHAYSATPMPYGSTPVGAYAATPSYTPVTPTPAYTPPATTTTTTTTSSAASAQVQQAQSSTSTVPNTTAVPVQLPASSLPALSALGIVPVPITSLSRGQPRPAAVLKGSSNNGAMVNLELNIASLQSAQINGLALILNALSSRGVNVDDTTVTGTNTANAAANTTNTAINTASTVANTTTSNGARPASSTSAATP